MKRLMLDYVMFSLLVPAAWAGVVVEMEVTEPQSPDKSTIETFYAQGEMVRMDPRSASDGTDMTVIFRDQTMWFLDHNKKVSQKIDKAGMAELSSQMDAIMKQLTDLPPEQREMMEKMMQGKMPGMTTAPPRRVEKGAVEQVGEYTCTLYTQYSADEKKWEVCAADESVGGDIAEAMEAFRALSRFTEELQATFRKGPFAAMIQTPYAALDKMGGFPVRVRTFNKKGEVVRESRLKSITRRDVEESVFAIPPGYKVKSLQDEMRQGR